MAVLSLPLTFQNSFWTQDYRAGLEVLYTQLENGVLEDEEIVAFIRARAVAEAALATTLSASASPGKAFAHDEGASMHVAFRGLKEESIAQGKAHEAIAKELQDTVAGPFEKWASGYKDRLKGSKQHVLDGWMAAYEVALSEVNRLRNDYLNKTRRADEAEDDARFAPITQPPDDKYTTSPSLAPRDKRAVPTRTATVSERISQRFKDFRLGAGAPPTPETKPEIHFDADAEEKGTPKVDKGKGRAIEDLASPPRIASPPPMSPPLPPARLATNPVPPPPAPPIILAGLPFTPTELSELLKRAKSELPLRPVRFPLLGEYQDCFSGEEFATWLKEKVEGFDGNLDRAAFAARELTEKHNLLRRLGELGNDFLNASDAFYQFRPKAFALDVPAFKPEQAVSPIQKNLSPIAESVAKSTNSIASLVSKALNANGASEPAYIKARREADNADKEYRVAIRKLDRQRLALEERIEETLKTLQKWELDRLRAVKTVLRQYQGAVSKLAKAYETSLERSSVLIDSYHPEADLKVFMERHRTGPFRPEPQVYESVTHDECDVVFGIDLRRWADSGLWPGSNQDERKDDIPPVLSIMLTALSEAYSKLPSDLEKRKTWIYDVPLPAVHHLRETLNAVPPEQSLPNDILSKYDAPVLAGAIKLWALELDPPIGMYEGWDELRKLYPTVGSSTKPEEVPSEEQHIQDLQAALQKLPRVHLMVLDAMIKHLKELISATSDAGTEEANEIYISKLSLTMGRNILRPKRENEISIQDRHPTLLFMDLITKYDAILPPTLEKKKRESQRKVPTRRRTRLVDMRMSRSRLSAGADLKELQSQQFEQRTGLKLPRASPPLHPPHSELSDIPASPNLISADATTATTNAVIPPAEAAQPAGPAIPPAPAPAPGDIYIQDNRSSASVPPPPPLHTQAEQAPAVPPLDLTPKVAPHPVFKEPPPEAHDLPPRPTFREPPPEPASPPFTLPTPTFVEPPMESPSPISPPLPTPAFKEPPPTSPELPMPAFKEPSPDKEDFAAAPRVPAHVPSALRPGNSRSASPRMASSRDSSPTKSFVASPPPTPNAVDNGRRMQGPRLARGPRYSNSGSGAVGNLVSNFNRQSQGGSRPGSPSINGGGSASLSRNSSRTYGGHGKRSSISRVSEFSRRTMASDAEDEIVDK